MKKSIIPLASFIVFFGSIGTVFAQSRQTTTNSNFFLIISDLWMYLNVWLPFLVLGSVLCFLFGLIMFIWRHKEGGDILRKPKRVMMYSFFVFAVVILIWIYISMTQKVIY